MVAATQCGVDSYYPICILNIHGVILEWETPKRVAKMNITNINVVYTNTILYKETLNAD